MGPLRGREEVQAASEGVADVARLIDGIAQRAQAISLAQLIGEGGDACVGARGASGGQFNGDGQSS